MLLDENLTWNDHIHLIENKVTKMIGILYNKATYIINRHGLRSLYSFIHSYLNYGNIVWASTNKTKTKLKRLAAKQREAFSIIDQEISEKFMKKCKN